MTYKNAEKKAIKAAYAKLGKLTTQLSARGKASLIAYLTEELWAGEPLNKVCQRVLESNPS